MTLLSLYKCNNDDGYISFLKNEIFYIFVRPVFIGPHTSMYIYNLLLTKYCT